MMPRPVRWAVWVAASLGTNVIAADLNHPAEFHPTYATRAQWEQRAQELREQVLVAAGLWPMPGRPPLHPEIYGRIDREGYTVERVHFDSLPGHAVTGTLYRPTSGGTHPAVLCPHGHWPGGRLQRAEHPGEQVEIGAERTVEAATYFLQARCATLARMGCVVFMYDMEGYADSRQIPHREGFTNVEAMLRLQSTLGLQLWNSIRSLDFLLSLPGVDSKRVGVTGASGGATQTLLLSVVDPRPTAIFPAVMISENMQGGCVCENAPLLRVGTNNAELAAALAPRPLGMSAANDWTKDLETRGFPEIRSIYGLYGAADRVAAKHFPFEHNYNVHAREMMYDFMNRYLKLGIAGPVHEQPFVPVPPEQLSVWDDGHPRPAAGDGAMAVRQWWTAESARQLAELAKAPEEYRRVVRTALRVMTNDPDGRETTYGVRKPSQAWNGEVIVCADGMRELLEQGYAVVTVEAPKAGPAPDPKYAGFTLGYNPTPIARYAHEFLRAVDAAGRIEGVRRVHLVAIGRAGPAGLVARAMAGDRVNCAALELGDFDFAKITDPADENFLPGALRYGGVQGLLKLCNPATTIRLPDRFTSADVVRAIRSPTIPQP